MSKIVQNVHYDDLNEQAARQALQDLPGTYRIVMTTEVDAPNLSEAAGAMGRLAAASLEMGFRDCGGELWLDGRKLGRSEPAGVGE